MVNGSGDGCRSVEGIFVSLHNHEQVNVAIFIRRAIGIGTKEYHLFGVKLLYDMLHDSVYSF